jgi:hypothetical protein
MWLFHIEEQCEHPGLEEDLGLSPKQTVYQFVAAFRKITKIL